MYANAMKLMMVGVLILVALRVAADDGVSGETTTIADSNGCKTYRLDGDRPNESVLWTGACKDGWLDGPGTLQWFEDGMLTIVVQSNWVQGKMSGYCKIDHLRGKFSYEGGCLNGKLHGSGEYRFIKHGMRFVGEFWEGDRHGYGRYLRRDGSTLEGTLDYGKWRGPVTETKSGGYRTIGMADDTSAWHEGPVTVIYENGHRMDTVYLNAEAQLGAACRYTFTDGNYFVGTIKTGKSGLRSCNRSRRAKLADFLDEIASLGATAAINAYALEKGYAMPASGDFFGTLAQITQHQAMHLQATQLQSPPPVPVPVPTQVPASQDAEIAALRAELAERDRQLAESQSQQSQQTGRTVQQPRRTEPAASQTRPLAPPPKPASWEHSHGYTADGSGGLIYNVYVRNTGEVPLSCDIRVNGVVWSATAGNNLQNNYTDRRTAVVHPGKQDVVAGFSRAVANSGSNEVSCKRFE